MPRFNKVIIYIFYFNKVIWVSCIITKPFVKHEIVATNNKPPCIIICSSYNILRTPLLKLFGSRDKIFTIKDASK